MTTHQATIAYWFGPEAAFGCSGHAQEQQLPERSEGEQAQACDHDWHVESYHIGDDGRPDTVWSKCSKCGEESEDDFN